MHSFRDRTALAGAALAAISIAWIATPVAEDVPRSVRVNGLTAGTQDQATLARAEDGTLAVAWSSRRHREGAPGLLVQRFAPDGARLGACAELAAGGHGAQEEPALAFTADGTLWTGWKEVSSEARRDGLFVRRADGIARRLASSQAFGLVLVADGDAVVAAWSEPDPVSQLPVARFQRCATDGTPLRNAMALGERTEAVHGRHVALAARHGGGFHAAWGTFDAKGQPSGIALRSFDGADRAAPAEFVARGSGAVEPAIAGGADGIALSWMQRSANGTRYEVVVTRTDAAGRLAEPVVASRPGGAFAASATEILASGDGGFVVAWNLAGAELGSERVAWRRYSATLQPLGDAELLPAPAAALAPSARASLVAGRGSEVLLTWRGKTPGDDDGIGLARLGARERSAFADPDPRDAALALPHDPPTYEKPATSQPFVPPSPGPSAAGDFGFHAVTNTGWTPPDPHLAVGPNHVVTMTNGAIAFFSKNGTKTFQQAIENTAGFWGSVGATNFVFDPEVVYDTYANRFLAMAAERASGPAASKFLLAVSDDSDPNGTWYKYRLDVTAQAGGTDIDSPNIAFDQNVIYLSADFFSTATRYLVVMLDKTPLLTGAPPTTIRYLPMSGTQSHGLPIQYGTAPAFYLVEPTAPSNLTLHAISNPLTTPTRVTTTVPVASFAAPLPIPQLGSATTQTTFGPRFWSCVWRNGSLWATHHIGSGSRTLARWYEIRTNGWPTSGTPTLAQSGTLDLGTGIHTSFSSIACDSQNNMLICCARSATTEYISIARGYRLASDPLGTLRAVDTIKTNVGPYNTAGRWGDYSQVAIDPEDGMSLWYTHEYSPNGAWGTWIGQRRVGALALDSDTPVLSQATGGVVNFQLQNAAKPGAPYLLLGSASGTSPGFLLPSPPGNVRVPLNYDGLTGGILQNLSSPVFTGFLGTLDGAGRATAKLTAPPLPGALGLTLHFAFVQDGVNWDFASNPIALRFVP